MRKFRTSLQDALRALYGFPELFQRSLDRVAHFVELELNAELMCCLSGLGQNQDIKNILHHRGEPDLAPQHFD